MVSSKMAGIKQVGHEVQKLTDLMERFHSLSKLYEAKPKGIVRKEKTFVENSRVSPKQQGVLDEVLHSNGNGTIIPKPMPPVVQRKSRKLSLQANRENAKSSGKSSKKQGKELTAKLHSGKEVGVKVYRLKDSELEENVKQSVPISEDDVKYSFHQPTQFPMTSEATLYQEALTSSRKYVNLNSRNHTLNYHFREGHVKANAAFRLNKANTISDFNFEHKKAQNESSAIQKGCSNDMFAKGNHEIFAKDTPGTLEINGTDSVSKEMEIIKSITQKNSVCKMKNATPKTFPRPLPITSTTVLSNIPEGSTCRNEAEEIFEENLKKATEKIVKEDFIIEDNVQDITSLLKMPKFVRSNEEIEAARNLFRNGRVLQERGQNLSATSYYISMHPHVGSLGSISVSDRLGNSPDSRVSLGNEPLGRPRTPANTPQSKISPFSSPLNGSISPQSPQPKTMDAPRLYPIANLRKESTSKMKDADSRKQQRKALTRGKGKIRKPASLKDPNLETCVQGRSLTQTLNGEGGTESPVHEVENELRDTKRKVRAEKNRSTGNNKKDVDNPIDGRKKMMENTQPIFDVCESFVIRSKQPMQQKISRSSPDVLETNPAKISDRHPKKLSPLTKLNTEMRRSKFILARTERNLSDLSQSPVRLMSDPVSFSVRHPSYVSSYPHDETSKSLPKPSKNVLLGKLNESRETEDGNDDAVIVFYHHENSPHMMSHVGPRLSQTNGTIPEMEELNLSDDLMVVKSQDLEKVEEHNVENPVEPTMKQKSTLYDAEIGNNMKRRSKVALTRLEQLQKDRAIFLRLVEQEFLNEPELVKHQTLAKSLCSFVDIQNELPPSSLSSMWRKFASNEISRKPTSYTMFSSQYPVKHDGSEEKIVKIENAGSQANKNKMLAFRLNYALPPSPARRYTFPFGHPLKPPIKPVKSVSSGSDDSGSKSLSITELNLEISPNDRHKHWFMPNLGHSAKLQKEKYDEADSQNMGYTSFSTLPEIQRSQFLSSLSKDQCGNDNNSEISAAILPDSSATYRFAHDVSFDEGSRYRTTDLNNGFKTIISDHGLNGLSRQFSSSIAMRNNENGRHDLRISGRDHSLNGNHTTTKDAASSSVVKADDKCELPPTLSPTSPNTSPAIAASTSNSSSYIPPPSASRQNVSSSNSVPSSNITFRLHKEKQNWSNRFGELSVNGGGYSNSLHGPGNNSKAEIEPVLRMNMTSAVQRNLQTRERALAAAPKSRISSRYSNKNGSACSEPNYADPCIAAPPSYQQRLMDLSLLESETVKYERNRKLKRKKNQDKDS